MHQHRQVISHRKPLLSIVLTCLSFGGILLTPILHAHLSEGNGYWASFGLPAVMMLIAVLIFVSGRDRYVRQPLSRENALIKVRVRGASLWF